MKNKIKIFGLIAVALTMLSINIKQISFNDTNVVNAIRIINNPKGLNIGARHISVSTSGLVPGIYRLADENIQCTLSISLHATNNEKRSSMMPVNNAFPIEELMQACKDYIAKTNRRIAWDVVSC